MSRQVKHETGIEVKNTECLDEAIEETAKEMGGRVVDQVRYHAGKAKGIMVGHHCVAVEVVHGKVVLSGEDYTVENKEFRTRLEKLLKKNYTTAAYTRVARRCGFREIKVSHGRSNVIVGV